MPAFLSHYYLAKETLAKSDIQDPSAFYLGAQGPDPFFYYGKSYLKRPHQINVYDFAKTMHHYELSSPFLSMWEKGKNDPVTLDYLKGFLLHYSLDRLAHPFVIYRAGWSYCLPEKELYHYSHMALESVMDYFLHLETGTPLFPSLAFKLPLSSKKKISTMWYEMNQKMHLGVYLKDNTYELSLLDYKSLLFKVNRPYPFKKWFLGLFIPKESFNYTLAYPIDVKAYEKMDFLNKNHALWQDPISGEEHHESFLELLKLASNLYFAGLDCLKSENPELALKEWVHGIDNDGAPLKSVRHYGSPLWKKDK